MLWGAALQQGKLRGAALDVFQKEPLPKDSPLWDMPNVLLSPHSADRTATFQVSLKVCNPGLGCVSRCAEGVPDALVLLHSAPHQASPCQPHSGWAANGSMVAGTKSVAVLAHSAVACCCRCATSWACCPPSQQGAASLTGVLQTQVTADNSPSLLQRPI